MTVNSALVNTILVQAPPSYRKASDRLDLPAGVASGWAEGMENASLERPMSQKGGSPAHVACER